jgi:uncharacterized protein DUF6134
MRIDINLWKNTGQAFTSVFERGQPNGVFFAMLKTLRASALILLGLPGLALAQAGQVVDNGSFTISVNGQRAGRETFRIVGTPREKPQDFMATGSVSYGDRRLEAGPLRADSSGTATNYRVEVRGGGPEHEVWKGAIMRGRVSATIQGPRGESAKEFVATAGAIILDDDIFHQHYFVTRFVTNGSVTAVIPRRNTQITLRVAPAGTERVTIGTKEIEARHYVLTEAGGGQRDVWIDSQDRLLKVAIPTRGIVALRDDPPA